MEKILIAGGTGFVGKHLIPYLAEKGYFIHVLTRKPSSNSSKNIRFFKWDIEQEYIDEKAFEGVTTLINLTGANIAEKRWTKERKSEIINSRIKSIDLLYAYITKGNFKVKTFISSSAVGFYGAVTTSEIFDETSSNGNDFLASVCVAWEQAVFKFEQLGIRIVILRIGVVIGKNGGMYAKLAPLAQRGIPVSLGNGNQFLPWIEIRDLVCLFEFIISHAEMRGIYNAVASEQITLNDFSKALLQSFGKKNFLPNPPAFLIQLFLGEMSAMLLEGSRVSNTKLIRTGFTFKYGSLKKSLKSQA